MTQHHTPRFATRLATAIELRFAARTAATRSLAFPCDAAGCVDMDSLDDKARNDYLYARALRGRDYAFPVVAMRDRSTASAGRA